MQKKLDLCLLCLIVTFYAYFFLLLLAIRTLFSFTMTITYIMDTKIRVIWERSALLGLRCAPAGLQSGMCNNCSYYFLLKELSLVLLCLTTHIVDTNTRMVWETSTNLWACPVVQLVRESADTKNVG